MAQSAARLVSLGALGSLRLTYTHIHIYRTRSQFCGGRKPECPEKTLEVRLRLTETQSTYNIVVEVEGMIDVHYASLTSAQGILSRWSPIQISSPSNRA